jgi:DNA-binding PadR family transcriptional regulator
MFGMRHFGPHCADRHAAGRHGRWGRHHRHGMGGGRHGRGGDLGGGDMMRAGRMLAQGDLRLLALALIAEQPRHGYEIIKVLEDKTEGWYAPSPGIVYPTLTYLEEAGYVTVQADGAKRLYSITAEGRAYLESNRTFVDAVLERLDAVGERMRSRRSDEDNDGRRGPRVPRLVQAALENLRDVAVERLKSNGDTEAKVVEVLARAAAELKKS